MKIAADKNILFAKEAFSTLGEVNLFDSDEITNENIRDFDVLLVRSTVKVNKELIEHTKIKFVGSAVAGTDHIDLDYLQEHKIGFSSAAGCNARSVVEYVLTAIYAFCEHTPSADNTAATPLHKGEFSPTKLCNSSQTIANESSPLCKGVARVLSRDGVCPTVGIIGVGNIGGKVAEILQNLGIKTISNDPPKKLFTPLDEIAKNSDIITIHTPLDKTTEGLLGKDFFAKMKPDALLIQASRGAVCDEEALLNVKNKIIDVWADEPNINWDLAQKSIFSTPHIAGHSYDGKINGTKIIYENCCAFFFEKPSFDFETEVFAKIEKQTLEFTEGSGSAGIAEILLKCCPIDKDSEEFLREKNFKKQRSNYRKRLEFSHYIVKNAPEEVAKELRILGFT